MSCPAIADRARRRGRAGFTLIEVVIAVIIISFLMFSVYRFVRANLLAIRVSSQLAAERESVSSLLDYLRSVLEDLPVRGQGQLLGNPGSFHNLASDEMTWVCRAGQGLLTANGPDEYRVTLAIQPVDKSSAELEIGLRRLAANIDEKNYNWLPLLRPAAALEIRYYDPRLNAWIERWSDTNLRPLMVRVRVWRKAEEPPLEAILPVPSARSQGVITQ